MYSLFTPLAPILLAISLASASFASDDLKLLSQRMISAAAGDSAPDNAGQLLHSLASDGSWPNIDYSNDSRAAWAPYRHVYQLLSLARAWHFSKKPEYLEASNLALEYWCREKPVCPNWWYNDIGVPLSLYKALLLLGNEVPQSTRETAIQLLERARVDNPSMTGQNLVWVAEATIGRGCLENDPAIVEDAFNRVQREIRVSSSEGIQADFSFHQHGSQLYSGGYGRGFSLDTPRFAALARETAFAFPPEKLELLSGLLLDGQQWMIRGKTFDYSACGREITRSEGGSAPALAEACRDLVLAGAPRIDELQTFQRRLHRPAAAEPLLGHKHFWRSDYTTFHQPQFMASLRMTSSRLLQTELVNSENPIGAFLSDGLTYFYRTGDEYRGIFPVWDWRALPGITEEMLPEPPRVRNGARGETAFAGGVSNGQIGASAMDFRRDSLAARKAWFFLPNTVLCLGTGISDNKDVPVSTTINQCLLQGDVQVQTASKTETVEPGKTIEIKTPVSVQHAGLQYIIPGNHTIRLSTDSRTGSWARINPSRSDQLLSIPVFTLAWDHGTAPADARYHYLVRGADSSAQEALPEVLSNTADCQAASWNDSRTIAAVFYQAGACEWPGIGRIAVDHPCILLAEATDDGVLVSAVEPTNQPSSLEVTIKGSRAGEIRLDLPEGQLAGSTVTRKMLLK